MTPGEQPLIADEPATLLVGRAREQAILRDRLVNTLAGRGGLVLIGGEAGIGKTALAEALGAEAQARGAWVLVGRCYDLTETPPYGPWTELLDQCPAFPDQPPPAVVTQGGAGETVASQAALFRQIRDFFAAVAARQPLVLLLDDLHWADPASLELLRFLARQLAPLPLLLVATYRADELTRRHPLYQLLPALVREARAARLDLRRLGRDDLRELARARYRLHEPYEARLVAYLDEHAEGNPFYAGELLRSLEEEGALRPGAEGWSLGGLAHLRVPALLRQVIDGRLARLGEATRELLEVAAVIGQVVPQDLWTAVSGADEAALLAAVERAVEARLLEEAPDGPGYRFAHALIREALYEGLLAPRRRGWHRQVAEALATGPSPDPDAVAFHLRQAGDARSVEWLIRAGERAQRAYAYPTAAERYEAALALMEQQGADVGERGWLLYRLAVTHRFADLRRSLGYAAEAERLAGEVGDRALAAAALAECGQLHGLLGDWHRGLPELEAGVAAAARLPSDQRVHLNWVDSLGGEGSDLNRYRGMLVMGRGLVGPFAEALALGEDSLAQLVAPAAEQEPGGATARFAGTAWLGMAIAHAMLGHPAEAQLAFAEARAALRTIQAHVTLGLTAELELKLVSLPYRPEEVAVRRRLAAEVAEELGRASSVGARTPRLFHVPLLVLEGQWADARAITLEGRADAHNELARAGAMGWLGVLAREQGEPELAWAQVREALPDGPATAPDAIDCIDPPRIQRLAVALALDAGDLATAQAWLECHDRWLAWSGAVLGRAEGQLSWAAYHRAAGDLALAREHAERALAHATEPRQPLALLAAHRLLGELDTAAGRHAEADAHLDQALSLAEACAAPYERALTLLATAELRAATGRQAEARALLDEAHAIFTPLDAKPALTRADALAARIAPAPAAYPAGLSAREVEVLRLVAQGLSNAQVAERLHLSPRTVDQHLRSIYNKLGVSSRSAATRFALEHQLS